MDPKRASGNLQLHCKSGTFSTFSFSTVSVNNLNGYLFSRGKIGACQFGLATSNADL